jgi:Lytic polysaccharide mono-oxygenase, cellulose-degrading
MKKWLALLILLAPLTSSAHSRLKMGAGIQPRSTRDGIKTGPCGFPKAATVPTLNAGDKITVNWEETINHPGRFEFRFSTDNDVTFSQPVTVEDTATGPTPHQYSIELTLPSVTCEQCTLQLVQVMTENPQNPSLYYSCADFRLVNSGAPAPTPPPASTPLPPSSGEDCGMQH